LTGLHAGTPVIAGAGDVLATSIGCGAVEDGHAYTILGTVCLNGLVMKQPDLQPEGIGLTFCQPGDNWVRMMVNVLGTPNLDWAIAQFFSELASSDDLFSHLEACAKSSGFGAKGLVYLPYLSPTGVFAPFVDSNARAQFYGLTIDHTRDDMLQAVYEGVAMGIRHCYEALPHEIQQIRLTGGGAKSSFWSQMIADYTGKQVIIPDGNEFGARGAALLAGIGSGQFTSVSIATELTASLRIHDPQKNPQYENAYQIYTKLTQALRTVW